MVARGFTTAKRTLPLLAVACMKETDSCAKTCHLLSELMCDATDNVHLRLIAATETFFHFELVWHSS